MSSQSSRAKRPIYYTLLIREDVWAKVYVNDLPILIGKPKGGVTRGDVINHLLVPGENELMIEILQLPDFEGAGSYDKAVRVHIAEGSTTGEVDAEGRPILHTILDVKYPDIWRQAPEEERRLPFVYRRKFDPQIDVPRPLFMDAPPAEFGSETTAELQGALQRLQHTVEARDLDAFFDEVELRTQHYEATRDGNGGLAKKLMREQVFKKELDVRPLDLQEVYFEPRRDGRVAYVGRRDGEDVIEAALREDPATKLSFTPMYIRHEGRWRVIL